MGESFKNFQKQNQKNNNQATKVKLHPKMAGWTKAKLCGNLQMHYLCNWILAVTSFYVTFKGFDYAIEKSGSKSNQLPQNWFVLPIIFLIAIACKFSVLGLLLEIFYHFCNSVLLGTSCKRKAKEPKESSNKISIEGLGVVWRIFATVGSVFLFGLVGYQLQLHEFFGIIFAIILCFSVYVWQWINYCKYVDSAFAVAGEKYMKNVKPRNLLIPLVASGPGMI